MDYELFKLIGDKFEDNEPLICLHPKTIDPWLIEVFDSYKKKQNKFIYNVALSNFYPDKITNLTQTSSEIELINCYNLIFPIIDKILQLIVIKRV